MHIGKKIENRLHIWNSYVVILTSLDQVSISMMEGKWVYLMMEWRFLRKTHTWQWSFCFSNLISLNLYLNMFISFHIFFSFKNILIYLHLFIHLFYIFQIYSFFFFFWIFKHNFFCYFLCLFSPPFTKQKYRSFFLLLFFQIKLYMCFFCSWFFFIFRFCLKQII